MFKPDTQQLWAEITQAEKTRDDHLNGVNRLTREYVGRWYRGNKDWSTASQAVDDSEINPEPFSYSFVSNMLPSLIYDNPSVVVKARRVIGHRTVGQAMQSGLRSLIEDINYKQETERAVLDMLFFQGILLHFIEDDTRWSDGAVRPNIKRIDFRCFGIDPLASCVEDAEYMYHWYYVDKEDLLADPAISPDAIDKLQIAYEDDKNEPFRKPDRSSLKRNQVLLYSIWIRRTNTIRVLAKNSTPVEVYPERQWYGPEWGPYKVFQAYPVPGQPYPLSPLLAVQDQVIDMNCHARSASRSAASRKTIFIVDGTVSNLPDDIKDARDREVIAVPGFNSSQIQEIHLGGVTRDQYEYMNFLRTRLDRHSGMTETMRGDVGAADTATEASIASDALSNRTEYLKGKVRSACAGSLKTLGWFLFHTAGVIIPVNVRDPITGMEGEGLFFGGPIPGQDTGKWDDYSIHIEPLSLQRVSEQVIQRRAMDFANFIMQIAPMIPQIPYLRWQDILRMVGEALNQDNADTFIIWEMLGQMSAPDLQAPSNLMPQQPPSPRYFSQPPYGFKSKNQAEANSNAPVGVDNMRQQFGRQFGPMGGGLQGPPGSAGMGALVPAGGGFR